MDLQIDGDQAHSTHYYLVVQVSGAPDKMVKNFNSVAYQDGQWLIAKRVAKFTWRDISDFVGKRP